MVYARFGPTGRVKIARGKPPNPNRLQESWPPGRIMSFTEIRKLFSTHESIQYLLKRGFDPDYLEKHYQVGYCLDSQYASAQARIYIPIHRNGMLVGWQCRFPGDDIDGKPLSDCGLAKYWTMPGMAKSLAPYNYDRAVTHPTVVIVEGPMDVWSTGLMSFGLLGITLSSEMRETFVGDMRKNHGEQGVVVVMLDPEMPKPIKSSTRPAVHPIEKLRRELEPHFPNRVVPVYLPLGTDPGSLSQRTLHEHIHAAARKLGVHVDFPKAVAS
jgi:hypothetical protein